MSERPKYQSQIEERIAGFPYGTAFSASDFLDIADANSVSQALFRIEKNGEIRRVINGVYDKPAYSQLIQEYGVPRIDKIAEALARRFNWNIAPSGDTALNILHISTQVPNVWEYVSDGPYRDYVIGKTPLKFKHVMPREINGYSPITVMIIQAIRAIGKGNMTQDQTDRFSSVIERNPPKKSVSSVRCLGPIKMQMRSAPLHCKSKAISLPAFTGSNQAYIVSS